MFLIVRKCPRRAWTLQFDNVLSLTCDITDMVADRSHQGIALIELRGKDNVVLQAHENSILNIRCNPLNGTLVWGDTGDWSNPI
jgi:hypothetical protein